MNYKLLLATVVGAMMLPSVAFAVPFKYDTKYEVSGSFTWGNVYGSRALNFGAFTIADGSYLYYDSNDKQLTIEIDGTTQKLTNTVHELDFLLGEAQPTNTPANGEVEVEGKNKKVVFDYADGAMVKDGRTQIGTYTLAEDIRKKTCKYCYTTFTAGEKMVFAKNMNPFIFEQGGDLYFQAWTGVWSNGLDIHADPRFLLTEVPGTPPGTEVPEPFTMGLLASGLLGSAVVRRKKEEEDV